MNFKRVLTLTGFDFFYSLSRLKGLAFLIPFALFWLSTFKLLLDGGTNFLTSLEGVMIISQLSSHEVAQNLLIFNPPTLSVFLLTTITVTPLFVFLGANNQLAADSATGTFRFLLSRCTRFEIFISRFLSSYSLIAVATTLICLVSIWVSITNDNHEASEVIIYALKSLGLILLYILPYVAFMTVFSALMSSALGTIIISACAYVVTIITIIYFNDDYPMINYLLPSVFKEDLIATENSGLFLASIGLLVLTGVYLGIAWLIFRNRNI